MKVIIAGLIILSLLAATNGSRKAIKQDARKVLDRFWDMQIDMAETEDAEKWINYWKEVAK